MAIHNAESSIEVKGQVMQDRQKRVEIINGEEVSETEKLVRRYSFVGGWCWSDIFIGILLPHLIFLKRKVIVTERGINLIAMCVSNLMLL